MHRFVWSGKNQAQGVGAVPPDKTMKYFRKIETLDELKAEYRRLALANHPDKGGSLEVMQDINLEFEVAFKIFERKSCTLSNIHETARAYTASFYTQNGWAGSKYNSSLRLAGITKIIRGYLKDVYPTWKFSVKKDEYMVVTVSVMETPVDIFSASRMKTYAEAKHWTDETSNDYFGKLYEAAYRKGYIGDWIFFNRDNETIFTEYADIVLKDIQDLVNSYRFSDSDPGIDYHQTNFYPRFNIGKRDRPVKVISRTARLASGKADHSLKKLAAVK